MEGLEVDQLSLDAAEDAASVARRAGRGLLLVINRNILGFNGLLKRCLDLRVYRRRCDFCFGPHDGSFGESGVRYRSEPADVLRVV